MRHAASRALCAGSNNKPRGLHVVEKLLKGGAHHAGQAAVRCGVDCCEPGYGCCGDQCIEDSLLRRAFCPGATCCANPDLPCADKGSGVVPAPRLPPRPLPWPRPGPPSGACCGSGYYCCNGSCKRSLPWEARVCSSYTGCCETDKPPADDDDNDDNDGGDGDGDGDGGDDDTCNASCCPLATPDCVCGGCTTWNWRFVVACAAGTVSCCEDPQNPCATAA